MQITWSDNLARDSSAKKKINFLSVESLFSKTYWNKSLTSAISFCSASFSFRIVFSFDSCGNKDIVDKYIFYNIGLTRGNGQWSKFKPCVILFFLIYFYFLFFSFIIIFGGRKEKYVEKKQTCHLHNIHLVFFLILVCPSVPFV